MNEWKTKFSKHILPLRNKMLLSLNLPFTNPLSTLMIVSLRFLINKLLWWKYQRKDWLLGPWATFANNRYYLVISVQSKALSTLLSR